MELHTYSHEHYRTLPIVHDLCYDTGTLNNGFQIWFFSVCKLGEHNMFIFYHGSPYLVSVICVLMKGRV